MPCPGDPGPRPTFIPLANCARLVMSYTIYGQTIENVSYFQKTAPYDLAAVTALVAAADTAWDAHIKPLLPPQATLDRITATATDTSSSPQDTGTVGVAGTNASAGIETTGNTLAIKFGTGRAGRSYRGRAYWPILIEGFVTANVVALSYANALVGALSAFFGDIEAATTSKHVIASYQNNCAWRAAGVATQVTSYSYTDRNLDSQRRRLTGRGI